MVRPRRACRPRCPPAADRLISSLCAENLLRHTKTPSAPGPQKKTNDTGLVATSRVDTHNDA
jgi:hypothetical protein